MDVLNVYDRAAREQYVERRDLGGTIEDFYDADDIASALEDACGYIDWLESEV